MSPARAARTPRPVTSKVRVQSNPEKRSLTRVESRGFVRAAVVV